MKLTEELGELCDEVLAHSSLQRKQKLDNHDKENLPEEFADVIITTLLLAKAMNVDIEKALEKKITMLREEGVKIEKGKITEFEKVLYLFTKKDKRL